MTYLYIKSDPSWHVHTRTRQERKEF